jgi:dTDP-4-dehydrorhamnose 3,5-epimerase
MPFEFHRLNIPELILVEPKGFEDERGVFMETFKQSEFQLNGIKPQFVQENYSHSVRGVLRGLHYQKHPKAQGKLVFVIRGEIFDVAVDVRKGSPTYGRWAGVKLSEKNPRMLYVPVGFAHGFCVLSDEADVMYKVTAEYAPEFDRGIIWNAPDIGVDWPVVQPILSPKDICHPPLAAADHNFVYERGAV